jgi:hypothetical protein
VKLRPSPAGAAPDVLAAVGFYVGLFASSRVIEREKVVKVSNQPANRHLFGAEVCTGVCTPSHESHADSRAARCREGLSLRSVIPVAPRLAA